MAKHRVGVVTFDLWDCLFADGTDEPKRAATGLPPKRVARRQLVHEFLSPHAPVARELVDIAYDAVDAAFNKVWHDQHVTWSVRERLAVLLTGLNRELPAEELGELVRLHEEMELEYRPDLAPHVREAISELHGNYPLAVVSDAIFSPGRCLRELLKREGLLGYFDYCVFSDELGRSKPDPAMFEAVANHFGINLTEIVHVGDRPYNDVAGAHAVGARAVLVTVVKKRDLAGHSPEAVCDDFAELSRIIETLDG